MLFKIVCSFPFNEMDDRERKTLRNFADKIKRNRTGGDVRAFFTIAAPSPLEAESYLYDLPAFDEANIHEVKEVK